MCSKGVMACRIALLSFIVADARAGTGGKDEGGSTVSPGSFRARLEFLGAELAAHGMISDLSPGGSSSRSDTLKLDARRTDARRLADRVEALKRVERSLLNCKRLGDSELLQACYRSSVIFLVAQIIYPTEKSLHMCVELGCVAKSLKSTRRFRRVLHVKRLC